MKRTKYQQTRLHFKKPTTSQSQQNPALTPPLKEYPRPTAPPFFETATPRKKRSDTINALGDDAWEVARRIMDGEAPTPTKRHVENGAAVDGIGLGNSDDDFESDRALVQVARQRPSIQNSASRMRNDRSSMTKRSGNRGKKTKQVFCFTTQSERGSTSNAKRNILPALESSSEEEEVNHVVFEGEKSELSDTDSEASDPPAPGQTSKTPTTMKQTSVVTRKKLRKASVLQKEELSNAKRSLSENIQKYQSRKQPRRSSPGFPRKTLSEEPRDTLHDHFQNINDVQEDVTPSQRVRPRDTRKRARDLPNLFSDDSYDSLEIRAPRRLRRNRTRIRRIAESSSEGENSISVEQQAAKQRVRSISDLNSVVKKLDLVSPQSNFYAERNAGKENMNDNESSPVFSQQTEKEPTVRQEQTSTSDKAAFADEVKICEGEPEEGSTGKPSMLTPKRKLEFSISGDGAITPPSTPSPPSTRRRAFRSRLIIESSDEDDIPLATRLTKQASNASHESQKHIGFRKGLHTPRSDEWYHEREIETFSSSGDENQSSLLDIASPSNLLASSSKKRISAKKPSVRRDLSKEYTVAPKNSHFKPSAELPHGSPTGKKSNLAEQRRRPPLGKTSAHEEVIDLVDSDDFEPVAPNALEEDGIMLSSDSLKRDGNENRESSIPPDIEDDSKPPPFNLYALCNEGESIVGMRDRLGEDALMDKVMQARDEGREVIGGDDLGIQSTFNKDVFSRFSKTVVGDQINRERKAVSVTEKALRGEYKFNYRGRGQEGKQRGRYSRKRGSTRPRRGTTYKNRLSNLRRQRR
ncbi:hypothetical protein BWQ96_02699 [Gracilariopsis chorda]|uniref:Uncharacterized protein n=1 Tax=Gracilariopsis chorda TaxID=448386 RepID=A0A2V3IZQ3_9FLOR|nr:hypothetical protein BWQ96_02699 [Gracilariopsis chorda]|eukprot:PXF47555.1 hypothetical protein BWQ96_02699 [Gracilariopsis chorda]